MKQEIVSTRMDILRNKLTTLNIDGFIIPSQDEFLGEYVAEHSKRLKWLTNFTGSNGIAIIFKKQAAFFTDGRYILQAHDELDNNDYQIYNLAELSIGAWIKNNAPISCKIGFDPHLHTNTQITLWHNINLSKKIEFIPCYPNIIDELWLDRPAQSPSSIFIQNIKYAGVSVENKIFAISDELKQNNVNAVIITEPASLCWLLNIRGTDIPYTPFVLGRAIVYANQTVDLFVNIFSTNIDLPKNVKIHKLDDLEKKIVLLEGTIQIDEQSASYWFVNKLKENNINIFAKKDPCSLPKACKNNEEIAGAYQAQLQDALALCSFFAWLEYSISSNLTELAISDKLLEFRQQQPDFLYPSFATIAAFAEHGAIIHYQPSSSTNKHISGNGLLLIDSGGQYKGGTTDITRTIAIGVPSIKQQIHFTLVLKGHIALAQAIFPVGTCGYQLDILARLPLWQKHLNYDHGTGHGVGSFLSVHEGPQNISSRPIDIALLPGMILSNEPGFYLQNEYGIRIENLVLVSECHNNSDAPKQTKKFLCFETITLVPLDKKLINLDLLTNNEIEWVNRYHKRVWEKLSPLIIDKKILQWLETAVQPI